MAEEPAKPAKSWLPALGLAIIPDTVDSAINSARSAEGLGFGAAWVLDSPCIWAEPLTVLGAIRATLRELVIGTGVTNVLTRHETVLASAIAALDQMSPGRTILGVGTGDSAVRMVGMQPARLDVLEAKIRRIRSLLRGEVVTSGEPAVTTYGLATAASQVPIYVAGSGPKLLELAGRVADGVIMGGGSTPSAVAAGLEHVDHGVRRSGRHMEDFDIVLWQPFSVSVDGAAARDAVKSYVARAAIGPSAARLAPADRRTVQRIRESYDYQEHMDRDAAIQDLVTDELVDSFAIAGEPEFCRARIESLARLPIAQLSIVPYSPKGVDEAELLGTFVQLCRPGAAPLSAAG